jgi:hypothetical protein
MHRVDEQHLSELWRRTVDAAAANGQMKPVKERGAERE